MPQNAPLNMIEIDVGYDWLQGLRTTTLGELSSITLFGVDPPKGFLEAFESVAHATSIAGTLSSFLFFTTHGWELNYLSLLPFTRLKRLVVEFSCMCGCTSTVNDDIITDLAQGLPELEILRFGQFPCGEPTGITAKGFAVLARHCPRLSCLSIHFQVASLSSSDVPSVTSGDELAMPQEECALVELHVGYTYLPDESASMVIEALVCIFPRLKYIDSLGRNWRNAMDAMMDAKGFVDRTRNCDFSTPRADVDNAPLRMSWRERRPTRKCIEVMRSCRFDRSSPFF